MKNFSVTVPRGNELTGGKPWIFRARDCRHDEESVNVRGAKFGNVADFDAAADNYGLRTDLDERGNLRESVRDKFSVRSFTRVEFRRRGVKWSCAEIINLRNVRALDVIDKLFRPSTKPDY